MVNFLLSDHDEAKELRSKFVFKIVPMMNPDGVVLGNTRASLLGCDLNRRWMRPSKHLHPEVYYTKSILKYLNKKLAEPEVKAGGVLAFIDVHGNHKANDMFLYACPVEKDFSFYESNQIVRALPDGVDRLLPIFNTARCRFSCEPEKMETARLVALNQLKIWCSYTLECSYNGSELLRKVKPLYEKIYSKSYVEEVTQNYQIHQQRPDIYFDSKILLRAAEDFLKGLNLASKKKPLVTYWFRKEPPVLVDINVNSKRDEAGQVTNEVD